MLKCFTGILIKILFYFFLIPYLRAQNPTPIYHCDPAAVLQTMIRKGIYPDPFANGNPPSMCFITDGNNKLTIRMQNTPNELGQLADKDQDAPLYNYAKNITNELKKVRVGEQSILKKVTAWGMTDGTVNLLRDYDQDIKYMLFKGQCLKPNDQWGEALLKIKELDKAAFDSIMKDLDSLKFPPGTCITMDLIKKNKISLLSKLRNFYLASDRAKQLCTNGFLGEAVSCEQKPKTTPELDLGQSCYVGCCDARRGARAEVELIIPVFKKVNEITEKKEVNIAPSFHSATNRQMEIYKLAATMSLMEQIKSDDSFFSETDQLPNIGNDRARFKKILQPPCNNNDSKNNFAVDSIRKIYWGIQTLKKNGMIDDNFINSLRDGDLDRVIKSLDAIKKEPDGEDSYEHITDLLYNPGVSLTNYKNNIVCPTFNHNISNMRPLMNGEIVKLRKSNLSAIQYRGQSGFKDKVFIVIDGKTYTSNNNYKTIIPASIESSRQALICNKIKNRELYSIPDEFFSTLSEDKSSKGLSSDPYNCLDIRKVLSVSAGASDGSGFVNPITLPENSCPAKGKIKIETNHIVIPDDYKKNPFVCQECKSGIKSFDQENGEIKYQSRSKHEYAGSTFDQYDATSFSLAAAKHFQVYSISDCSNDCESPCACLYNNGKIKEILSSKDKFRVLNLHEKNTYNNLTINDSDKSVTCFFTMPIPHACSVRHKHGTLNVPKGIVAPALKKPDEPVFTCPITEQIEASNQFTIQSMPSINKIRDHIRNCSEISFPSPIGDCEKDDGGPICKKKKLDKKCINQESGQITAPGKSVAVPR